MYTLYYKNMRLDLSAIILASTLILPGIACAQFVSGTNGTIPFTLSSEPQYPAPYSQVTLTILSDSLDLTRATMVATVAGNEIYQGNVQPITTTVGGVGKPVNVKVTIFLNGSSYSQTLSIQPQNVALVAEPISSEPPLYPGKPLVPLGGDVRIVAIADLRDVQGKRIDPTTCSYAWTVDGTRDTNASGIGKDAVIVASPLQYRTRMVSVVVMSPDGNLIGSDSISLSPSEPSVQIYKNDPLLGILYDHALLNNYTITGSESTLYAAPFSFPITSGTPILQWFLNGENSQTGNSITLRPTGSGQGNASLSLVASTGSYITATTNLLLSFGTAANSNFFGL